MPRTSSQLSFLFLLGLTACSSAASPPSSCTPGEARACACVDGRTGAQTCLADRTLDVCRCEGAILPDAGTAMDAGRVMPGLDSGQVSFPDARISLNEAPVILSLRTSGGRIMPDAPITVTAVVTDPDGIDDLIGGELFDPTSDAAYGAFTASGAEGSYSLSVTWDAVDALATIDAPREGVARMLRARFFDTAGHVAVEDVDVLLLCRADESVAACGGQCYDRVRCGSSCVDLESDEANCGACGTRCADFGTPGFAASCTGGTCRWDAQTLSRTSCGALCGAQDGACVATSDRPRARFCAGGCGDYHYQSYGCAATPPASITIFSRDYDYNSIACTCANVGCESGPENTDARCSDGCSNDGDRYVDCGDFDCAGHAGC